MSLPASYFDRLYEAADDPWGFRDRPYEARKRALTMAALSRPRYRSVFEPGCSIGLLTALLAERAEHLLAMDPAGAALRQARSAVASPTVHFAEGAVPGDWPEDRVELAVLSELGYYLDEEACGVLMGRAVSSADEVVAVHWRHPVDDYPLTGDRVHEVLAAAARAAGHHRLVEHVEEDFLLDVWSRDARSVARRSGLVG